MGDKGLGCVRAASCLQQGHDSGAYSTLCKPIFDLIDEALGKGWWAKGYPLSKSESSSAITWGLLSYHSAHFPIFLFLGGLRTLSTILRTALCAVGHAGGVERTANDVIAYTAEVLHTTTANEHDAVFLEVVAFTGDVGVDLLRVGKTHTSHFTHGGVRLFGGGCVHANTNTTTLRSVVESRRL